MKKVRHLFCSHCICYQEKRLADLYLSAFLHTSLSDCLGAPLLRDSS